MSDPTDVPATPDADEPAVPRTCPTCGTELQQATIDMDTEKLPRPEYRPGEHVAVAFCPNPACPEHPGPEERPAH